MEARNPATLWLEPFFDVSQPYLYVLILPPLVLFALGFRRFAVLFFIGAAALLAVLGAA
jgi:hypothetical protein